MTLLAAAQAVAAIPTATPFHVLVDHALDVTDSNWAKAAALGSIAAAVATVILASFTRNLAVETKTMAIKTAELAEQTKQQVSENVDAFNQSERHHQQAMMPLVTLDLLASKEQLPVTIGQVPQYVMRFTGRVKNIGPGPSISVNALVKPIAYSQSWHYLGIIAATAMDGLHIDRPFTGGVVPHQGFFPYDCLVHFVSVFGTEGFVHLYSHSGDTKDAVVKQIVTASTPRDEMKQLLNELMNSTFAGSAIGQPQLPPGVTF